MDNKLENIVMITLPEDRKIGDALLSKDIPLPVEMVAGQEAGDIDFNSIVAGLIKVLAWDEGNENLGYYAEILGKMQPETAKELNIAAIAKSKKGEYDFAEELMRAVNRLTDAPESYVNLAVLYAQMTVDLHKKGDDVMADMYDDRIADVLCDCIGKHPNYAPAYSELSAFHMRHGDVETARDYLAKFTELAADGPERQQAQKTLEKLNGTLSSRDRLMYAYDKMMMGCADEAKDVLDKYIEENGRSWEALFLRGWAKRVLEDFEEAETDLLESLSLDGKNAEVYNELSLCAREKGNRELAKSYLEIATDLDGENAIYATNLAFLQLEDGEFTECRENLEKARAIDTEDPQLKYLIEEYTKRTGDTIGDIIKEEIYTDEDFEELHRKEHEEHHHHEEI